MISSYKRIVTIITDLSILGNIMATGCLAKVTPVLSNPVVIGAVAGVVTTTIIVTVVVVATSGKLVARGALLGDRKGKIPLKF